MRGRVMTAEAVRSPVPTQPQLVEEVRQQPELMVATTLAPAHSETVATALVAVLLVLPSLMVAVGAVREPALVEPVLAAVAVAVAAEPAVKMETRPQMELAAAVGVGLSLGERVTAAQTAATASSLFGIWHDVRSTH